jgi:acetoin utilization deacetylase AcuC-like enzyme
MKTVYTEAHRLHYAQTELFGNRFVPSHEQPARADLVHAQVVAVNLGPVLAPRDHGRTPITAVHNSDYLDFLENAWEDWCAAGGEGNAIASCTPMPDMSRLLPASIFGRLGYYSFDTTAPITAGTWAAAYAAAQVALTGAELLNHGERAAFALCRPPGHHASASYLGGYCFLNNAAIAVQSLIERGMTRVAVLDVDYHHGNGTQSIFYSRDDVLFLSIHADPSEDYPYFLGHARETGTGRGHGYNFNFPLPQGSGPRPWFESLEAACGHIARYRPDALVVSLGVDTYEGDPISRFKFATDDYLRLGQRLVGLGLPALFVMEGGYNLDAIGVNVTNVLQSFS